MSSTSTFEDFIRFINTHNNNNNVQPVQPVQPNIQTEEVSQYNLAQYNLSAEVLLYHFHICFKNNFFNYSIDYKLTDYET